MYRLISKRELMLYAATIEDLRKEIERMKQMVDHERKRAEGAINLLLMRTVRAAITPEPTGITMEQEDNFKAAVFDLFGDGNQFTEDEALKELQR